MTGAFYCTLSHGSPKFCTRHTWIQRHHVHEKSQDVFPPFCLCQPSSSSCLLKVLTCSRALQSCPFACLSAATGYSLTLGTANPIGFCGFRLRLKCDSTRAETRFRLPAKRTRPFKSAGTSVQSTTGSRVVRISGSNAGYTLFRGSVKGTGYPLHSPVSSSLPLSASPCAITFQLDSTTNLTDCFLKTKWFSICCDTAIMEVWFCATEI